MKKLFLTVWLAFLLAISVYGQKKEIHILSANDMHANIEAFPQLATIIDSLRALYPSMLVLSAGDNRTGNPLNDMCTPSSYPMATLMNMVGFDATALGNHEFDAHSLPPLIGLSAFSYICANIFAPENSGIHTVPTKVFDVDGTKIGVIGVVQINPQGHPDTHPDNIEGIKFTSPMSTVAKYEPNSRQWDATILLSHIGYEDDIEMAKAYPWIDLIIGGHSHTQLSEDEPLHNGVLITQNKNKLSKVTHITLTIDSGQVVNKKAEYINVKSFHKKNEVVSSVIQFFSNNPDFKRVIAQASTPFGNINEFCYLMCDALKEESGAEIGLVNPGNARIDHLPAGDITVFDILSMDPFYNEGIVLNITGEDLLKMMTSYSRGELYRLPRISGLLCEVTVDKTDHNIIKKVRLLTTEGKKLKLSKTYRVATNSYLAATLKAFIKNPPEKLNKETAKMVIHYLEQKGTVSYQGEDHFRIIEE